MLSTFNSKLQLYIKFTFALVIVSSLYFFYNFVLKFIPHNSDNAAVVIEAADILRGNYLLHGWSTPNDTFYLLDVLVTTLFVFLSGFKTSVMTHTPAFFTTLMIIVSYLLIHNKLGKKSKCMLGNYFLAAAILVFPAAGLQFVYGFSSSHFSTVTVLLVTLYCFDRLENFENSAISKSCLMITAFATLTVACLSDPFAYAIVIAMFIVFFYKIFLLRKLFYLNLITLLIMSIVFVKLIDHQMLAAGGLKHAVGINYLHFSVKTLLYNSKLLYQSTLYLYGLMYPNYTNELRVPISIYVAVLIRLPLFFMVIYAYSRQLAGFFKSRDTIIQIMIIAIGGNIVAYLLNPLVYDCASARYLIPLAIFGAIIAARSLELKNKYLTRFLFIILSFCAVLLIYHSIVSDRLTKSESSLTYDVSNWLEKNNFTHGFGSYWASHIITLETKGKTFVRPLAYAGDDSFIPSIWFSNIDWYKPNTSQPVNFFVLSLDDRSEYAVNQLRVEKKFGAANKIVDINHFRILIWNKSFYLKV